MKVRLQPGKCAGHAQCHAVSPDLFPIDDDGYSTLEAHEIAPDEEEFVQLGVGSCPELALTIDED